MSLGHSLFEVPSLPATSCFNAYIDHIVGVDSNNPVALRSLMNKARKHAKILDLKSKKALNFTISLISFTDMSYFIVLAVSQLQLRCAPNYIKRL